MISTSNWVHASKDEAIALKHKCKRTVFTAFEIIVNWNNCYPMILTANTSVFLYKEITRNLIIILFKWPPWMSNNTKHKPRFLQMLTVVAWICFKNFLRLSNLMEHLRIIVQVLTDIFWWKYKMRDVKSKMYTFSTKALCGKRMSFVKKGLKFYFDQQENVLLKRCLVHVRDQISKM